jgi:hypothetical protein
MVVGGRREDQLQGDFHWCVWILQKLTLAGLGAGATEAVAVVTPMEVVKIRLQAQQRKVPLRLG